MSKRERSNLSPNERIMELSKYVKYEPDTGNIYWEAKCSRNTIIGALSGCVEKSGYREIQFRNRRVKAHRLAWFIMTGEFPNQVDHINHNRADNRWCNLREVTNSENSKNQSKRLGSDVTGVTFHKASNKWRARVKVNGLEFYLGVFEDFEQAVHTVANKYKELGFHENHGK